MPWPCSSGSLVTGPAVCGSCGNAAGDAIASLPSTTRCTTQGLSRAGKDASDNSALGQRWQERSEREVGSGPDGPVKRALPRRPLRGASQADALRSVHASARSGLFLLPLLLCSKAGHPVSPLLPPDQGRVLWQASMTTPLLVPPSPSGTLRLQVDRTPEKGVKMVRGGASRTI